MPVKELFFVSCMLAQRLLDFFASALDELVIAFCCSYLWRFYNQHLPIFRRLSCSEKCSNKLIFLTPCYEHARVCMRRWEVLVFRKILHTYEMDDSQDGLLSHTLKLLTDVEEPLVKNSSSVGQIGPGTCASNIAKLFLPFFWVSK